MSPNGNPYEDDTECRIRKPTSPRNREHYANHHRLERQCPLDNGRKLKASRPNSSAFSATLGELNRLPLELVQAILLKLDLQSLTTFRSVNHRARHVVDYLPLYKEVVTYAKDALRALLALNLAKYFTTAQLYDALRSEDCTLCGGFGGWINFLGCHRCCLSCIHEAKELLPLSYVRAKISFGLKHESLQQVPQFEAQPGFYTHNRQKALGQNTFVDQRTAMQIGISTHGGIEKMEKFASQQLNPWIAGVHCVADNLHGREALLDLLTEELRDGHDQKSKDPRRFLAIRAFPSLNSSTKSLERGVSCNECRSSFEYDYPANQEASRLFNRLYSKAGYLRHLENCELSQKRWNTVTE
ncbi:MAG: hypothetical protein M1830_009916 [Pleopsidium flavum]|nr:MAG: hypothetical protein M1830_009916 [Pleopsidium flavum]